MRSPRHMPAVSSRCRTPPAMWCLAARCWSSWPRTRTRAKCREQATMDADTRKALLARYKLGYQEVAATVQGLSEAALDARPPAGEGGTPRHIVDHPDGGGKTSPLPLRPPVAGEPPWLATDAEEAVRRRSFYG